VRAFDPDTGEVVEGEAPGARRRRPPLTPAQGRERARVQAARARNAERDRCIIEALAATFTEDDTPIRSETIGRVDALGAVGVRLLSCPEPKGSELVALVREQPGELGTVRTLSLHKRFVDAHALPWRTRGVTMTEGEARALRDALTAWLDAGEGGE